MRTIYCLSGLGADERAFERLNLSGFELHHIKWQTPVPNESIETYAARISQDISEPEPILLGLSFGGVMAVEIAKIMPARQIILVSSAKTRNEVPFYYHMAATLKFNKIIPTAWLQQSNFISQWFFGLKTKADRTLLKNMLEDTDPKFLRWAVDKIINWNNTVMPANTYHIHGTADRLLPFRFVKCDHHIPGGSHFMLLDRHEAISAAIRSVVQKL